VTIDIANNYCNDFEDATVPAWLPLHTTNKLLAHDWEFGTPNQTGLNTAASGSKAWMTRLDSNYRHTGQSALHTPFFVLDTSKVYTMSFNHNMISELYHDGGSVDWSYDGGITWYTLGNTLTNGLWYNTVHVTSLDIVRPGWSGNTNGYTNSTLKFTVENPGKLVFRFRFGSDYTIDNQGWAIDDFCLEEAPFGTPADIVGIGVPEVEIPGFFLGHVSPNPLNGQGAFMFNSDKPVTVQYTITNSLGQILSDASVQGEEGYNRVDLDASSWAAGLYMMEVSVNGQSLTRKFIVQH